ncbi:MAG: sigma-70 family RNA polymerase sigma factor [Solirubrobacteraceae bacterium]|nr:sigma-70 family RNA polymerase sigma factor [Patulibacter sp.]
MGGRARFEALYEAHAPAVRGYALRRIDPATADDVVSEVFLVAWRRLDDVPHEPRLWLLGVARRIVANHRRSAARWSALHDRIGHERPVDPAEAALVGVDGDVLRALAALSPTDREALLLVGWDDLAPREAAAVLGIRATNFTMRLSRARRRFAARLEAEGAQVRPVAADPATRALPATPSTAPDPAARCEVPDAR